MKNSTSKNIKTQRCYNLLLKLKNFSPVFKINCWWALDRFSVNYNLCLHLNIAFSCQLQCMNKSIFFFIISFDKTIAFLPLNNFTFVMYSFIVSFYYLIIKCFLFISRCNIEYVVPQEDSHLRRNLSGSALSTDKRQISTLNIILPLLRCKGHF